MADAESPSSCSVDTGGIASRSADAASTYSFSLPPFRLAYTGLPAARNVRSADVIS